MIPETFLAYSIHAGFALVMVSLVLAFVRLARGPSFSDRVVALDMMTVSIIAFCALYAVKTGVSSYIDIAITVALIGFLATVALARFAERGIDRDRTVIGKSPAEMVAAQTMGHEEERDP